MKRRGQAALEFLTTYGWAFLVILVMIGALAYFGVLDPSRFVPQRCQFGAPLVCDGDNYAIRNATNQVEVQLRNTLNSAYTVSAMQVRHADGTWSADCLVAPVVVPVDGVASVLCDLDESPTMAESPGVKQRLTLQVSYHSGDPTFTKNLPGEVYANVVA